MPFLTLYIFPGVSTCLYFILEVSFIFFRHRYPPGFSFYNHLELNPLFLCSPLYTLPLQIIAQNIIIWATECKNKIQFVIYWYISSSSFLCQFGLTVTASKRIINNKCNVRKMKFYFSITRRNLAVQRGHGGLICHQKHGFHLSFSLSSSMAFILKESNKVKMNVRTPATMPTNQKK